MLFKSNINEFTGLEFAVFKLKPGVQEADLIQLSKTIDSHFLAQKKDLLAHFLLRGTEGLYADVAIASTQEKAEEICLEWVTNEFTKPYLELLDNDSVDMSFWSRIS